MFCRCWVWLRSGMHVVNTHTWWRLPHIESCIYKTVAFVHILHLPPIIPQESNYHHHFLGSHILFRCVCAQQPFLFVCIVFPYEWWCLDSHVQWTQPIDAYNSVLWQQQKKRCVTWGCTPTMQDTEFCSHLCCYPCFLLFSPPRHIMFAHIISGENNLIKWQWWWKCVLNRIQSHFSSNTEPVSQA